MNERPIEYHMAGMNKAPEIEIVECSSCGEEFDIMSEGVDIDGLNFCSECRMEDTFICAVCEDEELEAKRGDIGATLLIRTGPDDPDPGVPDGVYRIERHPYYGGSIIGGAEVFSWAVRRLGDIPGCLNVNFDGYPGAHLCRYCDAPVQRKAILFRRFR